MYTSIKEVSKMYKLLPRCYKLVEFGDKETKSYNLEEYAAGFSLPKKVYGTLKNKAVRVWNSFASSSESSGVLLTGDSGAGKTLTANLIADIAIEQHVPVIYVYGIEITYKTILYLSQYTDVVIYIDEFRKLMCYDTESMMLSFLSDSTYKRLFILTENNVNAISPFIKNRPGRVRYHFEFNKLEEEVIDEYCYDRNVDDAFVTQLHQLYRKSCVFSFDHLQALVKEHLAYPSDNIETLLSVLNLKVLTKEPFISVTEVINVDTDEVYQAEVGSKITFNEFRSLGYTLSVKYKEDPNGHYKSVGFNYQDLQDTENNSLVLERDGVRIYIPIPQKG